MPVETAASAFTSPGDAPIRNQWGWVVPVACAVHCASAPFLVAFLPVFAGGEVWEWLFLVASGVLGWSILRRLPREREQRAILALGAGGLALWTASLSGWTASLLGWTGPLLEWTAPGAEAVTNGAGALMLASAMLLASHSCAAWEANACGCSACDTPSDFRHQGRRGYLLEGMWKRQ